MNGDLVTLIIGAIIGIFASAVTYYLNYALRLKEQSISREFTMRKEARHFFQTLYGSISRLADFVRSSIKPEGDKILIPNNPSLAILMSRCLPSLSLT